PAAAPPQTTASNQADALRMAARTSPTRDATEVSFFTQDHPGLFARMAGAFALVGASVMDARAFTTRDGMAVNTFWVRDSEGGPYEDPDRLNETMRRVLGGEITPRDALKSRRKLRPRERPFEVTPSVSFDNDASDLLTMIEVNCRDRVGLLHDLARSLANEHVNIVSAIIATYGEHVVDVFYVKDLFGMKITAQSKRARIERALLSAIDKAAPPS
ncbi:MAG: ACT domain-containing protein, partial [Pseudomonadota bacterium]